MNSHSGTVAELIDWGERELATAGVVCAQGTSTWRDEAAAIIYHLLELDHADESAYGRLVTAGDRDRCRALIDRRITERLPAAYLLGEAWFAGMRFQVDRRVLIPRSPFAALIGDHFAPWLPPLEAPRILEIGTGSGCIAVACARAFAGSFVVATDLSMAALEVAALNLRRHGVGHQVQLLNADLLDGIGGRFDLIISNPPYVPAGELQDIPPEFRWEPQGALDGGEDGLDLVRRIVHGAAGRLLPHGLLAIEVGGGAGTLERAFPQLPFVWPEFEDDADGIALLAAADLPRHNVRNRDRNPGG